MPPYSEKILPNADVADMHAYRRDPEGRRTPKHSAAQPVAAPKSEQPRVIQGFCLQSAFKTARNASRWLFQPIPLSVGFCFCSKPQRGAAHRMSLNSSKPTLEPL
jgi:hypothetical protein